MSSCWTWKLELMQPLGCFCMVAIYDSELKNTDPPKVAMSDSTEHSCLKLVVIEYHTHGVSLSQRVATLIKVPAPAACSFYLDQGLRSILVYIILLVLPEMLTVAAVKLLELCFVFIILG